MNAVDVFIEICEKYEYKNETIFKFLGVDIKKLNQKNTKNLIKTKFIQLRKNININLLKPSRNQYKNINNLMENIADDALVEYKFEENELEFLKTKNDNLVIEKFCVFYKFYPKILADNINLVYENFKSDKYILTNLEGFSQSNVEIEKKVDSDKFNKLSEKVVNLTKENKELEKSNKDKTKEIIKLNKLNSKLEDENKNSKEKNKALKEENKNLLNSLKSLEQKIFEYEKKYQNAVFINDCFGKSNDFKFVVICFKKIEVLNKIHTDTKFVNFDEIKNLDDFLIKLKNQNIKKVFVQTNMVSQVKFKKVFDKVKSHNLKCFKIFFKNENELNEKLCVLKQKKL